MDKKRYFFCGLGGNGMSPLARLLAARGFDVSGSDRSYDLGRNLSFFEKLKSEGIKIFPQDGLAVDKSIDKFVITRAVEDSIPDIRKAKELNLKLLMRPHLMAEMFANTKNLAIGGTSGKSTTTGMIAHILSALGKDPTVMNGAIMINYNSNFVNGESDLAVFEADESDGHKDVISVCPADVAVLTNISLDHFEINELKEIFSGFVAKAKKGVVLNADCKVSASLKNLNKNTLTFGCNLDADFSSLKYKIKLGIPGVHNMLNALAAVAAVSFMQIEPADAIEALKTFKGIKRRLEVVGEIGGIRVIDDFASNPGKIEASVRTAIKESKRAFLVFQPHGFQPTKLMKDGYIDVFSSLLRAEDLLLMPDIFYVGGSNNIINGEVVTLPKDISSKDITDALIGRGKRAIYMPDREEISEYIMNNASSGDVVLVMGSRDETLSEYAENIFNKIKGKR